MNYGVPYMGSKNKLAEEVVRVLPKAGTLYDVFAGGCAVTHKAMLMRKYNHYVANDITDIPKLFNDAVCGEFRNERRWISREDFFALKDSEPYVRMCWSFGNDGSTYIYAKEIEPYKQAVHYAVVLDDWARLYALCPEVADTAHDVLSGLHSTFKRRLAFRGVVFAYLKGIGCLDLLESNTLCKFQYVKSGKFDIENSELAGYGDVVQLMSLFRLQSLENLQHLSRLQSLENLQHLSRLQSLEVTNMSYRDIKFTPNSVLYCDPPYAGTAQYSKDGFDHEAFYEWALQQTQPIFISEYDMPSEFTCIKEIKHRCTFSASTNNAVMERIFVPKTQPKYYSMVTQQKLF